MMQATFSKRDMVGALAQVVSAADKRSSIPALACVLVEADGERLALQANNLFVGLSGSVVAEKVSRGSIALPAHPFLERVKAMSDGPIVLTITDGSTATLKAAGSARKFVLRGMPGADFPPPPRLDEGAPTTTISASVLGALVAKVIGAISTDESRPHLNAMLFEWEGTTVRAVSTDGHRLHLAETTVEGVGNLTMLIPLSGVNQIKKLCEAADTVSIGRTGSNAFFTAGGFTLAVKLVDATFPPYRQVIPRDPLFNVEVSARQLRDVLRAVAVSANERTGGVKLIFDKGATVRLEAQSVDGGESEDIVTLDTEWTGPALAIGVNAGYVISACEALGDVSVKLGLTGELDPMLMSVEGGSCTVMPLRI